MPSGALDSASPMNLRTDLRPSSAFGPTPGLVERWRGRRGLVLEALGEAWLPWLTARVITLLRARFGQVRGLALPHHECQSGARITRRAVGIRRRLVPDDRRARLREPAAVCHPLLPIASAPRPRTERHHLAHRRHRIARDHERSLAPARDRNLRVGALRVPGPGRRATGGVAHHARPSRVCLCDGVLGGAPRSPGCRLLREHTTRELVVGRPLRVSGGIRTADRLPPGRSCCH